MQIGVPKERKRDERRVALTPEQARALVGEGHGVWVEQGAAEAVGWPDGDYARAGARVVAQGEVYERAELLLKVKCPIPDEYPLLRPRHVLFAFLHFDENIPAESIRRIVGTGITGIAYEWVRKDDRFPLLQPMSELTGAVYARKSMALLVENAGILGGAYQPEWGASRVMVIGGGHIGANAINVFLMNRFDLVVVDKHPETLALRLGRYVAPGLWEAARPEVVKFDESKPAESVAAIHERLGGVRIVLGCAVRRPTLPKEKCEYLIRRAGVATMRRNSVLCDATACDRDLFETCTSSDSLTETHVVDGVVHYSCDHIPSLVPRTATELLTAATFPYVRLLANGFAGAVRESEPLARGVMCHRGKVTHAYSAGKKHLEYTDLASLI